MKTIPHKVHEYLHILNTRAQQAYADHLQSCPTFIVEMGRKYMKVIAVHPNQRSVHSFLDQELNLYKAAGWAAPAKGIRFNLTTDMNTLRTIADIYGGYLYKGSIAERFRPTA